jgi:hypothetical protein
MYYDPSQEGKELSWDQLYRAEFGLHNLQHRNVFLDLELSTWQFFDENRISLKKIILGGSINQSFRIEAGSYEHGFGADYGMDNIPGLIRGYQTFNYQAMRMNSLALSFIPGSSKQSLRLDIGGNIHNQASAKLMYGYDATNLFLKLSQDLRTMDNHWRTPVSISALEMQLIASGFDLRGSSAVSLFPDWDSTDAHHELYTQAEISFSPINNCKIGLGSMYLNKEYAPRSLIRHQIRAVHLLAPNLELIPLYEYSILDDESSSLCRLLLIYEVLPDCTIGFYYDYSTFNKAEGRNSLGLALDFGFDLGAADQRM